VLHPVAELAQHRIGDVGGVLGDEVDADALGANQADHLLHLLQEAAGGVAEQQVRLIEEEHQLGLLRVAHLGQLLEQLGEQPEQEGGVELRRVDQPVGGQHIDVALAAGIGAHEIGKRQRRLAEQALAALVLQHQQLALDGGHRRRRHRPVTGAQVLGVLRSVGQRGLQVLEVQQQQALGVGGLEDHVQRALLHVVQLQHPREQHRPHLRDGGADRVALLPEQVPEHHRRRGRMQLEAHGLGPGQHLVIGGARRRHAAQVALHVGGEHRHAGVGQALGDHLQGDGLAGAGGAGHQAVPVGAVQPQQLEMIGEPDQHAVFRRHPKPPHRRSDEASGALDAPPGGVHHAAPEARRFANSQRALCPKTGRPPFRAMRC
jgi:hypothetical protein